MNCYGPGTAPFSQMQLTPERKQDGLRADE